MKRVRVNNLKFVALSSATFLFIVAIWWLVTHHVLIPVFFLPSPLAVAQATKALFVEFSFARDVWISVARILAGFTVAAVLAIPIGIGIGFNRHIEAALEPLIDFIRYTPVPAFIPLFILWFGVGELEKVIVIAASVFFQLVLMVAESVHLLPDEVREFSRSLGVGRSELVHRIVWPFTKPHIYADLRISMGWAWAGLIIAEIVGASSGIGFVIIQGQRLLQTPNVIAAIIVVGVLGVLTDFLFKKGDKLFFPWIVNNHK
ncbi:ABC transporter permease [Patescibacteria group bacterium]